MSSPVSCADWKLFVRCRQGDKGVAFSPARDCDEVYTSPPEYDTEDYEGSVFGKVHVNILALLNREIDEGDPQPTLKSTSNGVEHIKSTSPVFTETMSRLLYALRIFSVS